MIVLIPDYCLSVYFPEAKDKDLDPVNMFKTASNLFLTVPRRHICCCSIMLLVVISMCIWSPAIWSTES